MKISIFYSWQSWTDEKTNKRFVGHALELALRNLKRSDEFDIEYVIDRDTKGLPGTPAIADSILQKIDHCGLFLCDLTVTTQSPDNRGDARSSPNPNVLLELGYAVAKLGWQRIITVMNEEYGQAKELPFNLRHRKSIRYTIGPNSSKKDQLAELVRGIETAIKSAIQTGVISPQLNPKDARVLRELEQNLFFLDVHIISFIRSIPDLKEPDLMERLEKAIKEKDRQFLENPTDDFLRSIIALFSKDNLERIADNSESKFAWGKETINTLLMISTNCDSLLQRYADRDDKIISLVEDLRKNSRQLAGLIDMSYEAIAGVWSYGLRDLLKTLCRSYWLVLDLNGEIEIYNDEANEYDH